MGAVEQCEFAQVGEQGSAGGHAAGVDAAEPGHVGGFGAVGLADGVERQLPSGQRFAGSRIDVASLAPVPDGRWISCQAFIARFSWGLPYEVWCAAMC